MLLPFICSICIKRANILILLLLICLICKKWGKWAIKKTPPKRGLVLMCPALDAVRIGKGGSYSGVSLGKPTIPVKRISRSTMPETPITR